MTPRETPIRIVRQGAIRVASACVEREGGDIVAVSIDCHTKRYDVYTVEAGGSWSLYLTPNEHTIRQHDTEEGLTWVELPEFGEGWEVFTHDSFGRYVARLCLVRRSEDEQRKEDDDGN